MNLTEYFLKGLKGTLRFNNGKNLSYKGPWVQMLPETVMDEFFVGDFMAAEYTICIDGGNFLKEVIKCLVVAGPENTNLTPFGRTNLGLDLISLSATVDASRVKVIATPLVGPGPIVKDGDTLSETGIIKMIFSANYYYTINELSSTSQL
jgi:hypothetical protein